MLFNIGYDNSGRTVLSFLKSTLKISSAALAALKRDEFGITVNGKHVTVRYVLCEGDRLCINEKDSREHASPHIVPANIPLDIIFENDDIIVVNKPADMPTHPSHNHNDDTLANAIAYIYAERDEPLVFRPIGRLDRNTSGISLIAKHAISASFLSYARTHGMMQKRYVAILNGHIESDGGLQRIETHMKRMQDSVIVRCVSDSEDTESFLAVTHWRLLYSNDKISLVEAIPETGRTHQLRVHFAHIGHSILGDDLYGEASDLISRHALHAASLSMPIPYTDNITQFSSLPPSDMQNAFKDLSGLDLNNILAQITKHKELK